MGIGLFIISFIMGLIVTYIVYLIMGLLRGEREEKKERRVRKAKVGIVKEYGIVSNIGGRSSNEDSGVVVKINQVIEDKMDNAFIAAVADGAGGHKFGELASSISISSVLNILPHYVQQYLSGIYDAKELMKGIYKVFEKANSKVIELRNKMSNEMIASTLSVGVIVKNKLFVGHVGDSAIFVYRPSENKLVKVTRDHSRNGVLYKAVGATKTIEPDIFVLDLVKDDIVILVSDGAIKYTSSTIPIELFIKERDPQELAKLIVEIAYKSAVEQGRKPDNITAVVINPWI